jgi:hypothetical protein
MKRLILSLLVMPSLCFAAKAPDCADYPTNSAIVFLKNMKVTDPTRLDESKTKAVLLAATQVGKRLFHEVYDITFTEHSGKQIEVITSSDASLDECSWGDVVMYLVARKVNGDTGTRTQ